ncbi:hypothetical protein [Actinomadura xylanilytica]|nr:hypothetical protein [Actinomadura xylanilytica]MDL4773268.1 hypothetical protein [Actinomadura xylanilytica]
MAWRARAYSCQTGAAELEQADAAEELLREFFAALYREFKVTPT